MCQSDSSPEPAPKPITWLDGVLLFSLTGWFKPVCVSCMSICKFIHTFVTKFMTFYGLNKKKENTHTHTHTHT